MKGPEDKGQGMNWEGNCKFLEKGIYEHKRSIKLNDDRNALFSHMLDLKDTFNFSQATLIKTLHCKKSIFKTKDIK